MTELNGIFLMMALFMTTVSANSYTPATQREYQQYQNYRQLQQQQQQLQQQQHWQETPFADDSYLTQNLQQPYQVGMQSNAAFNQRQHQPLTTLRQTWSGAPIVVDYVDDDDDDIVQDIDVEQQSVQLAQTASADAAAAELQPASTLQSRKPQTFNDAFVPYKHQFPQQAFYSRTKAAYKTPHTQRPLYSSGPTEPPTPVSYLRQARLLPFSAAEAAMHFGEQRPWVVKSTSLANRAPSLVGRERLERFATYAPIFERYVKKYPRRLVAQYYPASSH